MKMYLMRLSVIPSFALSSSGTEAWVITEGSSARDSYPPRDSARVNTSRDLILISPIMIQLESISSALPNHQKSVIGLIYIIFREC